MAEETRDPEGLSPEELAQQQGEELRDREVMSVITPDPGEGRFLDSTLAEEPIPLKGGEPA